MSESTSLVTPPLGGKFRHRSSDLARELSAALALMTAERDEAESREIQAWRVAVAVLTQAFGGTVNVDATLLSDRLPRICTEHDARTGKTRIWLDPEKQNFSGEVTRD